MHELTFLRAVQDVLPADRAAAMARLAQAWQTRGEHAFGQAMQILADSVATMALTRAPVAEHHSLGDSLKQTFKNITDASSGQAGRTEALNLQRVAQQFAAQQRLPEGKAAVCWPAPCSGPWAPLVWHVASTWCAAVALAALWKQRSSNAELPAQEHAALAQALQPLIRHALQSVLQALYPASAASHNPSV